MFNRFPSEIGEISSREFESLLSILDEERKELKEQESKDRARELVRREYGKGS